MSRGEPGSGKWSVVVKDTNVNEHNGTFTDWRLTLWGECIDPSTQQLLPMPEEDENHEVLSAEVSTATFSTATVETGIPSNPTDHIDRPVNAKPTPEGKISTIQSAASPSISMAPSTSTAPSAAPNSTDNLLPHYFPTFGVSKRTQVWIYGALAIIILFCAGLGIYFVLQRRKRLRNNLDEYEFDALDDDDARAGVNAGLRGRRTKKRAGELYDAFAGESDEELLLDEEKEYRDVGVEEEEDGDRGRSQSRKDEDEKR